MSNFAGYFVKNGSLELDSSIIASGGYSSTPLLRTDKNSTIDGNGNLKRNILPVKRTKFSIKTVNGLTYLEKLKLQAMFPNRDVVTLQYWNDETNDYETNTFYVPDIEYVVDHIDCNGDLVYQSVTATFISYGGDQ